MSSIITEPSICIPRTLANVTWKEVKDIFEKLIGPDTVERVDLVKGREHQGETSQFCRIFIHFRSWPIHRPEIANVRDRLLNGMTLKVVYDNPWFWKCVKSNVEKPQHNRLRSEPFIMDVEPVTLSRFNSPIPTRVNLDTPPGAPQKDLTNIPMVENDE